MTVRAAAWQEVHVKQMEVEITYVFITDLTNFMPLNDKL